MQNTPGLAPSREYAFLVLLAFLWGGSYSLIKVSLDSFSPLTLMAVRVSIAAIILTAISAWHGSTLPKKCKTWFELLIQAFFNSIGAWTMLAWGQQYVDSGLAGVLNSTSPIFVFFITLMWTRHESVDLAKFFGAVMGFAGVVLIIGVKVLSDLGRNILAQLAILLGALLYASAAIFGRRFKQLPPIVSAAGTMIWATIWLVPVACIVDQPWHQQVEMEAILAVLLLSIVSTAGGLLIYFRLVNTLGSMGVASQAYLRSVIAVIIGVIFLGEAVSLSMVCGVLAIVIGMFFINGGMTAFQTRSNR